MKELEIILKDNPFTKLVGGWQDKLNEIIEKPDFLYNSEEPSSQEWFCLPSDETRIRDFNNDLSNEVEWKKNKFRLHPEFIPQPFIGHPSADIWFLNINPSWFASDVFAMLNNKRSVRDLYMTNFKDTPGQPGNGLYLSQNKKQGQGIRIRFNEENDLQKIRERGAIMLSQLLLDYSTTTFFPLNECFNIVSGNEKNTMYNWWRDIILGSGSRNANAVFVGRKIINDLKCDHCKDKVRKLGQSVFVLEMNPYRSLKPDDKYSFIGYGLSEDNEWGRFWKRLVKYGIMKKKTFIMRAKPNATTSGSRSFLYKKFMEIFEELEKDQGGQLSLSLYLMSNVRNPTLSSGNLMIKTLNGWCKLNHYCAGQG